MQLPRNAIHRVLVLCFTWCALAGATAGKAFCEDLGPALTSFVRTPIDVIIGTGVTKTISMDVSDPDGDPITSFSVTPTLPGASFNVSGDYQHAEWSWTPTMAVHAIGQACLSIAPVAHFVTATATATSTASTFSAS